jgi:DNA polymerase III subunit epsilon
MPLDLGQTIAFVDLETTGSNAVVDRITEVGIVLWDEGRVVERWSSLVNPETPIPGFIQGLTGITDEMVAQAPLFAQLAPEILDRLQGRLFVAHNARFDHGFLKNELRRAGFDFRPPVLCTVKLSRKLFPQHGKHNLDALIQRHGLKMPADARHRALGDADVLAQFWERLQHDIPAGTLDQAVGELTGRSSWPTHLDPGLVDELPDTPGVYRFMGEGEVPLYIGKAVRIRQRVMSHFSADHRNAKEMNLSQQVRRVDWLETPGEMGALLTEALWIKQQQPIHNVRLRRLAELCTWVWRPPEADASGELSLAWARDLDWGRQHAAHGLFGSKRDATTWLRELAETNGLCQVTLGLEKAAKGKPCFAFQMRRCAGACVGQEPRADHDARLATLLADWRVRTWPFEGPIKVGEGEAWHVVDAWSYLGLARNDEEVQALLANGRPAFDKDTYRILMAWLPRLPLRDLQGRILSWG